MKRRSLLTLILFLAICPASLFAQNGNANPRSLEAAMSHFIGNARAYGLSNPVGELRARGGREDEFGVSHIRFDQFYNGVKVFEGEAIAHVDDAGGVWVTNALKSGLNIGTSPKIPEGRAVSIAMKAIGPANTYDAPTASLEILPRGERSAVDRLVWHVLAFVENDVDEPAQWDYFVDAQSGAVVWFFNSLETTASTGTGKTMYVGNVAIPTNFASNTYALLDPTRGGGNFTCDQANRQGGPCNNITRSNNIFGNNVKDNSDRATAGADAHYGMTSTWDYFKNNFSRNGIDNAGRKTYSRVHYGRSYQNAFWSNSCFCMTYGDGGSTFYPLVSIDVAGHEMAHGVLSTEANLTYAGESGGLNESSSDIFGTLVEFEIANSLDTPEYWIGERIYKSNWSSDGTTYTQTKALRYMDDPAKDGQSPACWSSGIGSLDVHYSSGPNNQMFYLLSAGGTSKCNGSAVTGIGRSDAARIWYKAIADYMTSSTNYSGARTACLSAAVALFGSGSAQYAAVNAAYAAIDVTQ